jgi:hypothetical protein
MTKEKPPAIRQNPVLWDAAMMTLAAYRKQRVTPLDAMQDVEQKARRRRPRRPRNNVSTASKEGHNGP